MTDLEEKEVWRREQERRKREDERLDEEFRRTVLEGEVFRENLQERQKHLHLDSHIKPGDLEILEDEIRNRRAKGESEEKPDEIEPDDSERVDGKPLSLHTLLSMLEVAKRIPNRRYFREEEEERYFKERAYMDKKNEEEIRCTEEEDRRLRGLKAET